MKKRSKRGIFERTIFPRQCEVCGRIYIPRRDSSRHCSRACFGVSLIGKRNHSYRGARTVVGKYIFVRDTERGRAIGEHRKTMEELIGRKLTSREVVHHINGDSFDNRPENLKLIEDQSRHRREHATKDPCRRCNRQLNVEVTHYAHHYCRPCYMKAYRYRLEHGRYPRWYVMKLK